MKKVICLLVALILTVSVLSVDVFAASAHKEGDVLYKQDFESLDAVQASKDYSAYGYAHITKKNSMAIEDGGLKINSNAFSGRYGTRVQLYKVDDSVDRFSFSIDLKIKSYSSSSGSYGPGVLLADNGVSDKSTGSTSSVFSMIWLRAYNVGTTGAYTYGDTSKNAVSSEVKGFCSANTEYNISVYVNRNTNRAAFRIHNKTLDVYYSEYDFYYNPANVNPIVGLYANGCNVVFDNLTVYYGDGVFAGGYTPGDSAETYPPVIIPTYQDPAATTDPTQTGDPDANKGKDAKGGANLGLVIGIEVAVVAVAAVVAFALKKKKK